MSRIPRPRWNLLSDFLLAMAALFLLPAASQAQSKAQRDALRGRVSRPVVIGQYGVASLQSGELRLPRGSGPFPIAIVIHGGCWTTGVDDRYGTAPFADALTRRGVATWNVSYRRVGDEGGGWPGTFEDVAAAVDYVRVLAESFPLDLTNVSLIGHSAGAHLALWAASRGKLRSPVAGTDPFAVQAVFALDGPGDLASFIGPDKQICGSSVIQKLMGGLPREKPEAYEVANPADHLPLGVPTTLVMAELRVVMLAYARAARRAGEDLSILEPERADHFSIITPGSVAGDQVIGSIVNAIRGRHRKQI